MELSTLLAFFNPPELRELIANGDCADVMINQDGAVFSDNEATGIRADLVSVRGGLIAMARSTGRDFSQALPILNVKLPNGSRLSALLHKNGDVSATIRRFLGWLSAEQLVENGTIRPQERDVLRSGMSPSRGPCANILTSGATGSGKTVLTNAVIGFIPPHHRLIYIENPSELPAQHVNCERWEADPPTLTGPSVRSEASLLAHALRNRPDHVVLGEVRSPAEAFMTLQAMNTGHDGSLTTIHANSAVDALDRFTNLAMGFLVNFTEQNIRGQVLRAFDYVVHMDRDQTGKRRLMQLLKVDESGQHKMLYEFEA